MVTSNFCSTGRLLRHSFACMLLLWAEFESGFRLGGRPLELGNLGEGNLRQCCSESYGFINTSSDCNFFAQIDILDCIEQSDPFGHRTLKSLSSGNQSHSACAFVNHRGDDGILQVACSLGLPAAVDQANPT